MSNVIYLGIVVAVSASAAVFVSQAFGREVSRAVEAAFDFAEYRLALRARARQTLRREEQLMRASAGGTRLRRAVAGQRKGSTQQLGVARIAA